MEHDDVKHRFRNFPPDAQLRVLATLGHNLTIAARDSYEFQAPRVRAPHRLRDINEIQHRVFGHPMPNSPQSADKDNLEFQRDIDEVFSRANPNPDRVGCPPRETLAALARRQQPIGDPGYEHLAKCSPCFREFKALQAEFANAPTASPSSSRRGLLLALAAGLVLALGAGWWFTRGESVQAPQVASAASSDGLRAEIDLRPFAVVRSEQAQTDVEPVSLPRGVVDLALLLPVGSEPGAHDVQLLDENLRSQTEATGAAAIESFVTTLRVRVDLRAVEPGRYQLAVRRQGDSWRMFPAVVR